MIKLISICLIGYFIFTPIKASIAIAPERTLQEYSVKELVVHFAKEYQVSEKQMLVTMSCESNFNPSSIGDSGKSFGLSQIHLPSNPTVTKEQALDKVYATEFMAKAFSKGQQKKWTCWRMNYL